jgi:GNAT superfamily N-acetyltransferase
MTDVVLPNQQVWLAVAGGEIAAFIALLGNAVEHLYVMPEHQRRGIGDRLLALAKEHSSGELRLHCFQKNANGRAFYEARGFAAIAFSDGSNNKEHEPDILYRWTAR